MSSPMFEIPKHLPYPVDADGKGPSSPEDTVRIVCWCDEVDCNVGIMANKNYQKSLKKKEE